MRTLHVVRHGRTAANAGGLLLGRLDPGLDAEGERQAAAAAAAIAATAAPGPVRIVCSPLQRCRSTAAVLAAALGERAGAVDIDDRWIELDYGELDGTPLADVSDATWSAWRADLRWTPPGGESLAELGERVRDACQALATDAAEGDVVVVTHVSPVKAAAAWALGVGDEISWRLYVAPGSIARIAVRPGAPPSLHAFNVVP